MWFQRAFIASRGSSVIAVAMDQGDGIDTILNIFLTVKRNILEYCLDKRRMDSKYIALDLRGVTRGVPNNFATGSEGYEKFALLGGINTIRKDRPIII